MRALTLLFCLTTLAIPRALHGQTSGCPVSPAATVDAALMASDLLDVDVDALRRRVGRAALLPVQTRLELRATDDDVFRIESRLDQDFDEHFGTDGTDLTDVARSGVDQLREARVIVVWDLSDAIWSSDHLAVSRLARDLARERQQLSSASLDLYFAWTRACALPDETGASVRQELSARLDALTGGWFSRTVGTQPTTCPASCVAP